MKDFASLNEKDPVGEMLSKLSALWVSRAAVNNEQTPYSELAFNPAKADFSESLLPFRGHDAWREAPAGVKEKCLSYAWVIYNLKTIYIECNVVTPACEDIIKSPPVNSPNREVLQSVMAEALLDEALHTKMSISASNYIYHHRQLPYLDYCDFNLIGWRNALLSSCTAEWQRRLTRFGIACASETLITDYLKTMAEDSSIQTVCHEVTRTHAMDEWSHSSVFSFVAIDIVSQLSTSEKVYLHEVIKKTVSMFANNEMGAWKKAFSLAGLEGGEDIVADVGDMGEINVYTGSVNSLLARVGLESVGSGPVLACGGGRG